MDEENYFELLPVELVLKIFQYLTIRDLMRVKYSFSYLCKVAETQSVWKGRVWRFNEDDLRCSTYMQQMKDLQLVQAIEIPPYVHRHVSDDTVIESALSYVKDLRLLSVPDLSRDFIPRVIQKYPNLESLSVHVEPGDTLAVLEKLAASCENLKRLDFIQLHDTYSTRRFKFSEVYCKEVCELLESSFPQLTSINLKCFQTFLKNRFIATILKKRAGELRDVEMSWDGPKNDELIKIISGSDINLDLTIYSDRIGTLDLEDLEHIKCLKIRFYGPPCSIFHAHDFYFLGVECLLSLPNVQSLELLDNTRSRSSQAVNGIVSMFPKLKLLKLCGIQKNNYNDQLFHLKFLSDLEDLSITAHERLTKVGILHISHCSSLKRLTINTCKCNDRGDIFLAIKSLQKLSYLRLISCLCEEKVLLSIVRSLHDLEELYLTNCKTERGAPFKTRSDLPLLVEECSKLNICLVVTTLYLPIL